MTKTKTFPLFVNCSFLPKELTENPTNGVSTLSEPEQEATKPIANKQIAEDENKQTTIHTNTKPKQTFTHLSTSTIKNPSTPAPKPLPNPGNETTATAPFRPTGTHHLSLNKDNMKLGNKGSPTSFDQYQQPQTKEPAQAKDMQNPSSETHFHFHLHLHGQ